MGHGVAARPNVDGVRARGLSGVSYLRTMHRRLLTVVLFVAVVRPFVTAQTDTAEVTGPGRIDHVEEKPEFPGGEKALYSYLSRNVKYPKRCRKQKITGKVWTEFTIDKDGTVTDVRVVRGVHPELDAEAARVIKAMPRWKPGHQDGRAVKVKYTIPISFMLKNSVAQKGSK